ncbi:alpha/beta hydrolase [Methyloversatilis sp. RAC08]|uniref:alpha/beta hydrolase n=1 Tax=Methyloversatilis sp. RAC08 TaxID=1842540 RepID=UPI00083D8A33|nr:alpha/beta hydrolase [Methyloversatilis sp. RAC08]
MNRRPMLGLLAGLPLLAGCSATGLLNLLAPSAHRRDADIAYGPHRRMKLDVYRPLDTSGPAPVVVFFYGGSWNAGRREDYLFVGAALAERGIVTVIPDYRLYPEVVYPAFLDDCAAAVAWTMDNAAVHGADADRLHVAGHSAGAYNAAMLALDARWLGKLGRRTDRLAGLVGLAGPYDFLPIVNPDVKPVFNRPGVEDPAPADSQPLRHVSAAAPRSLLIAARKDDLVNPQRNTGGLAQALRGAGVAVDERYYDGVNHLTLVGAFGRPLRGLAPVIDDVAAFLGRTK